MKRIGILIPCVWILAAFHPVTAKAGAIAWEPYEYHTRDGHVVSDGERGRLNVPEDHAAPDGKQIELSFIRFRSTAPHPGPPIIWLAGGPSDFGSDDIEGPYLDVVRSFQAVADVIALDQRGTGLSQPRLDCPDDVVELPLDHPLDPDEYIAACRAVSARCASYWASRGVDLATYTTEQNADDVATLCDALGAERVSLYGGSYGSHLGLSIIRRHPDRVYRAVFAGIEGPDQTWKSPSVVDAHFAAVARALVLDDEHGGLLAVMHRVLDRLDREPVAVDVAGEDGDTVRVVVGGFDARMANLYFLGGIPNIRRLPGIYDAIDAGDYSTLGQVALDLRRVSASSAMYYCMDCASGTSPSRMARIEHEYTAKNSLVGRALNIPFPGVCAAWPVRTLDDDFRSQIRTDVPTLFISGALDGQTPPSNLADILPGFSCGFHLVVENASHQYLELADPGIQGIMVDFLNGIAPTRDSIAAPALVTTDAPH